MPFFVLSIFVPLGVSTQICTSRVLVAMPIGRAPSYTAGKLNTDKMSLLKNLLRTPFSLTTLCGFSS
jgi:hypothetical protein